MTWGAFMGCRTCPHCGGSISYWADSFSVDEYRILRVKSVEFGDVTVSIRDDERMFVSEVSVKDELDEFLSDWGLEAGDILPPGYPESRCSGQGEPPDKSNQ